MSRCNRRTRKCLWITEGLLCTFMLAGMLLSTGCGSKPAPASPPSPMIQDGRPEPVAWRAFRGDKALAHVKALCDIGPHPSGSPDLARALEYLEKELKAAGWITQREQFTDVTPYGQLPFFNLRARWPVPGVADQWSRPGTDVLLCSHYDTKFFSSFVFVGANDSGSSTGLLLEAARVLPQNPWTAARVELVFFDGEEAVVDFRQDQASGEFTDGLYGSRYHARAIRSRPKELQPKYGILFDMVGDKDLRIEFPANTSSRLNGFAFKAAEELGKRPQFGTMRTELVDDHVPLARIGMEVTDFIDFSYEAHWHKPSDTFDKLSAESLTTVGQTGLLMVEKYLPR